MIIRNFEYLLALNREKHFARAAAACRVSQPALSAGIKQLEEDMDVLIVKRGQRFEGFTAEGERVLTWAQQMLDDCLRLKQELHELRENGLQGAFRIGMLPATSALASVLSVAFGERFPALEISVVTQDAARLLQLVRQSEIDVALTYIDESVGEGLDGYALYRERMLLFTSQEAGDGRRVSWAQAKALPLCLLRGALPKTAEAQLAGAAKVIYTDSPAVLAAHVETGRWATVLPQSLARVLTRTPALRAIAVKGGEQANVGFVAIKNDVLPAAVHALMEMAHTPDLVEELRGMLGAHKVYLSKAAAGTGKAPAGKAVK